MVSEERKQKLLLQINKLDAYHEIQNLMGRTMAAFNFREADKVLKNFALDNENVWLEFADEGVFEGKEAVTTIVNETVGKKPLPGEMIDLQLTTPIIEVAGDLQTAEAVWWCPGAGSVLQEKGDPKAIWLWGSIAADFVNENGEWKILHLHYFRDIKCDYKKGWVEDTSMVDRPNKAMHPMSKPTTYHNPYTPLSIRYGIPAAPYEYEHYTDSSWMTRNDKTK